MKVCIADPPYIGQAKRHYSHDPNCAEVNHPLLIDHMCDRFDCWALCASSTSLQYILPLCPNDVRILSWVKPFTPFKKGVGVAYSWEPVIIWHPRPRSREQGTVFDHIREPITMQRGLVGVKPDKFCYWLFDVLNLQPDDELEDLFPGAGTFDRCWKNYCDRLLDVQLELFPLEKYDAARSDAGAAV